MYQNWALVFWRISVEELVFSKQMKTWYEFLIFTPLFCYYLISYLVAFELHNIRPGMHIGNFQPILSYSSLSNNHAAHLINFLKNSNLHALIPTCTFINFGKFQTKTFFFTNKKWKIPTCTALFHPTRLLILGNFKPKPLLLLIKSEKFQPALPYSNLHVYWFLEFCQPARLFHPARLLGRLE